MENIPPSEKKVKKPHINIEEKNHKNLGFPNTIKLCISNTVYDSVKLVGSDKMRWILTNNTKVDKWDIMW